jgi:spermidine/putrescine transport system substrate-binding protein
MAARMIQVGWIQKLDASKVPNLHANVIDALKAPAWDPGRDFSAPWQSGLTGIAYNKKKVKEVRSFSELLTRDDLRGRISLLSEMRDTMGFMLLMNGADPAKFTQSEWEQGIETLKKARGRGQVRAFTGNEYIQDLSAGNILACEAWSGDVAAAEDENLVFVPPEEGLMIWADNMLVPNLATHQANAEEWINYYYEPEIAARLADYVYYICPVKGAQQEMEKIDPDLLANETLRNLIFPDEKTLATTHGFMALDEAQIRSYEGDFADVTSG